MVHLGQQPVLHTLKPGPQAVATHVVLLQAVAVTFCVGQLAQVLLQSR